MMAALPFVLPLTAPLVHRGVEPELSGQGDGASFGFAFLRMPVTEGGPAIIVRAATAEGGPIQRLQIKDK